MLYEREARHIHKNVYSRESGFARFNDRNKLLISEDLREACNQWQKTTTNLSLFQRRVRAKIEFPSPKLQVYHIIEHKR